MRLEREYKEVFDFYSGASFSKKQTITFDQLLEIMGKVDIDVTREELKEIIKSITPEDSDNIGYSAFVELFDKRLYKDVPKHEAVEAFRLFDKENTGKISINDFKHIMQNLSEGFTSVEITEFLKLADRNNDGFIHYKEFVDFMKGE